MSLAKITVKSNPRCVPVWFLGALLLLSGSSSAIAQEAEEPEPYRATGFWPDIALALGGGIGINGAIDTNLYGALRLGVLFAYEPWVFNLGIIGELGALPKQGIGAEVEVNYLRGPYLQFGYDRMADGDFMIRSTLGFALFGVQWQHRLAATKPSDALIFVLRLPLGIGWFFVHDQERRRTERLPPPPIDEANDDANPAP
jgi:hypothetical protein